MTGQLLATALVMGLVGSPHCAAMCGAGCGALARSCQAGASPAQGARSLGLLLLGRSLSYAAVGALAAASTGLARDIALAVAWLKPFWGMAQAAALLLGLSLLWLGRQPQWLDAFAVGVNRRMRSLFEGRLGGLPSGLRLVLVGALWVALPCGLLYSALVVAALASSPLEGALVMGMFSIGGALVLFAGPQLWWRLSGGAGPRGAAVADALAVRLAGAMLVGASAFALDTGCGNPSWSGAGWREPGPRRTRRGGRTFSLPGCPKPFVMHSRSTGCSGPAGPWGRPPARSSHGRPA